MPITTLDFNQIGSFPYPVATGPGATGTAMTCTLFYNDPMLATLTQTTFSDEVVYLHLDIGSEMGRVAPPTGRETISGMAYDVVDRVMWATQITNVTDELFSFDPDTGQEIQSLTVPADMGRALACNGLAPMPL